MQKIPEPIEQFLQPVVEATGYEWVGGEFRTGPDGLLRIYIDSPEGITLDDCERVSDAVSGVLDVEDPFPGQYRLEISSPGLERPLFRQADFERFVGRPVVVRLNRPIAMRRRLDGVIESVENDVITVTVDGEPVRFAWVDVHRANLAFDFDQGFGRKKKKQDPATGKSKRGPGKATGRHAKGDNAAS